MNWFKIIKSDKLIDTYSYKLDDKNFIISIYYKDRNVYVAKFYNKNDVNVKYEFKYRCKNINDFKYLTNKFIDLKFRTNNDNLDKNNSK